MLVELDRLYLLAGPKEEFEESEDSLEQVSTFLQSYPLRFWQFSA